MKRRSEPVVAHSDIILGPEKKSQMETVSPVVIVLTSWDLPEQFSLIPMLFAVVQERIMIE